MVGRDRGRSLLVERKTARHARGGATMYEMNAHVIAEPKLREIRHSALPSMQRRREHERELCLLRDGDSPTIPSAASPQRGMLSVLGRLGVALKRRSRVGVATNRV